LVLRSRLLLFFFGRKKQLVQDLIPPLSIYIHMCTLYTYKYVNVEIQSIWILRALQVCRPDPWAHIRAAHMQCVCVCVRIHTHTTTYTHTCVKKKGKCRQHPYLFSCQKYCPTPGTGALHEPNSPTLVPQRQSTNCVCTSARTHPAAERMCLQICILMSKIPVQCTPAHALVLKPVTQVYCMPHSPPKMYIHLHTHACATVQQLLCHVNHCAPS